MRHELRAMSVGEVFNRALRIYLGHFWFLLAVTLALLVPVDLLYLGVSSALGSSVLDQQMASLLLTFTVGIGSQALLAAALIHAVSDIYLGVPESLGRCLRGAAARFFPVLAATVMYSMIIGTGIMFCIIPGLLCMGGFFATIPAVMVEHAGPLDALGRSWKLSEGMRRRAFAAILFAQLPAALLTGPVTFLATWLELTPLHAQVLTQTVGGLAAPYASIVLILLYYDFRIRKEAFDLQVLASELGRGAPPAPPAVAAGGA